MAITSRITSYNVCYTKLLRIDFKLGQKNILVTFHPVTLEEHTAEEQFRSLLDAINTLEETHIIFTKANSDTRNNFV